MVMTPICDTEKGKNTNLSIVYIKWSKQEYKLIFFLISHTWEI